MRTLKQIEELEAFQRETMLTHDALEVAFASNMKVEPRQCIIEFRENTMSDLDMALLRHLRFKR